MNKFRLFLRFRVEPFLLFFMLSISVRVVTDSQLIQDKICKFEKHSNDFCKKLSKIGENSDDTQEDLDLKSSILIEASKFQMYYMGLQYLPSVIACLFLGSWCDNYLYGRKILLLFSAFGILLETVIKIYMAFRFDLSYKYLILAAVPSALGGGQTSAFTAIYSYIPATTPHNLRAIRFMLVEVIIFLASPIAGMLGGYLLNTTKFHNWQPIGNNGQLNNYILVFIASLAFSVISIIWVIFFVDEVKDKQELEKYDLNKVLQDLYVPNNGQLRPLPPISVRKPKKHPILMLFDCGNIKDVIKTCTKRRNNKVRKQLWLIALSFVLYMIAHVGPNVIMFPFAQKVYLWDSSEYSIWHSAALIANSIGTIFATLLLAKYFGVNDIPLAIIGICAYFLSNVLKGTFPNIYGFYSGVIMGSIGAIGNVGMRSHLSKIIDKDELGKVFSLIASLDSSTPLVAIFVFTLIFTQTLNFFPGAVFEVTAALLFIPLFVMIWIDICCNKDSDVVDSKDFQKVRTNPKLKVNTSTNSSLEQNEQLAYKTKYSGGKIRTTDL